MTIKPALERLAYEAQLQAAYREQRRQYALALGRPYKEDQTEEEKPDDTRQSF
jgi:hypothetical protein